METTCPNCGHRLVSYRKVRQRAARREVVLHWLICQRCRQVVLGDWFFDDGVAVSRGSIDSRRERERARAARRTSHLRLVKGFNRM